MGIVDKRSERLAILAGDGGLSHGGNAQSEGREATVLKTPDFGRPRFRPLEIDIPEQGRSKHLNIRVSYIVGS